MFIVGNECNCLCNVWVGNKQDRKWVLKIENKRNCVNENWTKVKILDIAEMDNPTYLLEENTRNILKKTYVFINFCQIKMSPRNKFFQKN